MSLSDFDSAQLNGVVSNGQLKCHPPAFQEPPFKGIPKLTTECGACLCQRRSSKLSAPYWFTLQA